VGRLQNALRDAANPRWALAYWRARNARIPTERRARFWEEQHAESLHDSAGALAAVTGEGIEECRRALEDAWLPDPLTGDPAVWWPREPLSRLVAALALLTRPRVAVEVGVARGYTSAAILGALDVIGEGGRLHSIDLPPRDEDPTEFVGRAIPKRLRDAWELTLGPSRQQLAPLAQRLGEIDYFFHDGDHSYRSQREDLETVWPHLRRGAVVAMDDVWTPAIFDFAKERGETVAIASWAEHSDGVGLLRKA
jgi:predicted O-methyltransferase YrrM